MGTVIALRPEGREVVGTAVASPERLPPGCKGQECPAFATCQARCATRRMEREARLLAVAR